ncbi:uncharacterized protein MELLADRAFT_114103 [Melampsora larici-populina 98AG31]|uniref:Uncharacterized protein n=1 Tax=Melampsora larici-populina (strain 98AG31 / pathotype 3-4-7) TaxID=747676 RepID=F4SC67_MELLP|nr:uncharacterized protein MELLADRAFT_114103 [Melampsora larici-populina 98AG31]EGF97762.1 hypothetical protein MELLADRAFT_114103 [Melampsora larici-populina 98AG31]
MATTDPPTLGSARKKTLRSSAVNHLTPEKRAYNINNRRPTELLAATPSTAVPKQTHAKVVLPDNILASTNEELGMVIENNHYKRYNCRAKALQVVEKKKWNISAVNLTKDSFTDNVEKDIMAGVYAVIYVNLSIQEADLKIVRGELSRSNITILRVQMDHGLRKAMDLKNLYAKKDDAPDEEIGTIPCRVDDPRVIAEQKRELAAGFPTCKCSNCRPKAAEMLICNFPRLTKKNYKLAMEDPFSVEGFLKPEEIEAKKNELNTGDSTETSKKTFQKRRNGTLHPALKELADELVLNYRLHYNKVYGEDDCCESEDYFGLDEARAIVNSLDKIKHQQDIEQNMGGDIIEGGVKVVFDYIEEWRTREVALEYSQKKAKLLETKTTSDVNRVLTEVTNITPTPTGPAAPNKKKRRSSAQVKADKEATVLKAAYNWRCLDWLRVDKVPYDQLDAKEEAYQNKRWISASGLPTVTEFGLDWVILSLRAMFRKRIMEFGVDWFLRVCRILF